MTDPFNSDWRVMQAIHDENGDPNINKSHTRMAIIRWRCTLAGYDWLAEYSPTK